MSVFDWEPDIEFVRYDDPSEQLFEHPLDSIAFADLSVLGAVVRYQTVKQRVVSLRVRDVTSTLPTVIAITKSTSGKEVINKGILHGSIDAEKGVITSEMLIVRQSPIWRVFGKGAKCKTLPPPLFGFQLHLPDSIPATSATQL